MQQTENTKKDEERLNVVSEEEIHSRKELRLELKGFRDKLELDRIKRASHVSLINVCIL